MNSASEEENQELTDNEDAEPKSNIYLQNEINQYDILLKDNETYRQRIKEFQDLQSDIINWLKVGSNSDPDKIKSTNDEYNFPKAKSPSEIELTSFFVNVRPYHDDAIVNVFNCP